MIIGIGSDLVDIRRIERTLARFGRRFEEMVFTAEELARAAASRDPASTLAKRFAAKEACAKALGSGIRATSAFREMGVVNDALGRPALALSGRVAEALAARVPRGFHTRVDLTLTDDHPYAQAFVVISAWPEDWPA